MTTTQCKAAVVTGNYTYAARNTARQCENAATMGGYCHAHRRYAAAVPFPVDAMAALRASLERPTR